MNRVQLVCTNHGHYVSGEGVRGIEIVARLYDKRGLYFEGKGSTDAEAIGSLICHCPEKFNARFDIRAEFEESDGNVESSSRQDSVVPTPNL